MVGLAWASNGTNYFCENQGNNNSWLALTCEGTQSGNTPFGTRVHAIASINGKRVIQTREITPTTGHNTTYPSTRLHFGLGNADMVDTLIIKWPMGQEDAFNNVKANQFYHATEDGIMEVDFKATNYIRQNATLVDTVIYDGESLTFNLEDYYEVVTGDTVRESLTDILTFSLLITGMPVQ